MAEVLYTGRVPLERLEQIASACHFAPEAIFLAESLPVSSVNTQREREALLQFIHYNQQLRCSDYDSGRIFQHDRELRWEREKSQARVVYLGEIESEAELAEYQLEKMNLLDRYSKESEPTYYSLFGERLKDKDLRKLNTVAQKGDFAVLRIPRTLRYPVKVNDDQYARLIVCEYVEEATGQVALFRFQGVESWGDAKKQEEAE
jgi:hypothetical protein